MRVLRSAVAFLLSLHAVGMAQLAYSPSLTGLALVSVFAATILGLTGPGPASEPPRRDRAATYRVASLWGLYSLYLMSAFLMASAGDRSLAAILVGLLAFAQLMFLAWPAIGPRAVPLLVNALSLCVLSAAAGGYLPLFAVAGFAPLAAALIVVDHHHLRRARPREALLPAAGHAGLAALVVWPLLPWLPLTFVRTAGVTNELPQLSLSDLTGGTLKLLFWGAVGLGLLFFARWLLDRLRGEDEAVLPDGLEPAAEAGASERLSSGLPPLELDLSGARGRIVAVFEDFLARADRLGFERRPNWTAAEFARRLPMPASRLARLFGRARYSEEELEDRDAEAAAADAENVLTRLRET